MKMRLKYAFVLLTGIFAFCFEAFAAPQAQKPNPFLGDWKGALSIGGEEFDIVFHFTLDAEGKIVGSIDSPSQNGFNIPAASITIDNRTITFTIPDAPGNPVLKGVLDETGKKMTGTIVQSNTEGQFKVEKAVA